MKGVKKSIEDYEIMAGIQYALYESYAVLVLEQLKKSKDSGPLKVVLSDVMKMQSKALDEWLRINIALADLVEKEYSVDLVIFQLSENSITNTKYYKDLIDSFRDEMYAIQQMIARNESEYLDEMIASLSDYVPQNKDNDFVLNLFITRNKKVLG